MARYNEAFGGSGLRLPPDARADHVAHLYVVRVPDRDQFRAALLERGVGTDAHYPIPDHHQVSVSSLVFASLPVTEEACRSVVTLPCYPELTDAEVAYVIECVAKCRPG
jgi:aminotransferase EvaB